MTTKGRSEAVSAHEAKMAALRALEDRQGRLTPNALVAAARDEDHPWHDSFEWDDAKAAQSHRVEQAREILRTWRPPKIETTELRAPSYLRDPRCGNDEQGYVSTVRVRKDADLTRSILLAEFERAGNALQRAYDIANALDAREEIGDLIARINLLRTRSRETAEMPING